MPIRQKVKRKVKLNFYSSEIILPIPSEIQSDLKNFKKTSLEHGYYLHVLVAKISFDMLLPGVEFRNRQLGANGT